MRPRWPAVASGSSTTSSGMLSPWSSSSSSSASGFRAREIADASNQRPACARPPSWQTRHRAAGPPCRYRSPGGRLPNSMSELRLPGLAGHHDTGPGRPGCCRLHKADPQIAHARLRTGPEGVRRRGALRALSTARAGPEAFKVKIGIPCRPPVITHVHAAMGGERKPMNTVSIAIGAPKSILICTAEPSAVSPRFPSAWRRQQVCRTRAARHRDRRDRRHLRQDQDVAHVKASGSR